MSAERPLPGGPERGEMMEGRLLADHHHSTPENEASQALYRLPIPPVERLILYAIADMAVEGVCQASYDTLARVLGVPLRTLKRHMMALSERGLVVVEPGRPNRYRIDWGAILPMVPKWHSTEEGEEHRVPKWHGSRVPKWHSSEGEEGAMVPKWHSSHGDKVPKRHSSHEGATPEKPVQDEENGPKVPKWHDSRPYSIKESKTTRSRGFKDFKTSSSSLSTHRVVIEGATLKRESGGNAQKSSSLAEKPNGVSERPASQREIENIPGAELGARPKPVGHNPARSALVRALREAGLWDRFARLRRYARDEQSWWAWLDSVMVPAHERLGEYIGEAVRYALDRLDSWPDARFPYRVIDRALAAYTPPKKPANGGGGSHTPTATMEPVNGLATPASFQGEEVRDGWSERTRRQVEELVREYGSASAIPYEVLRSLPDEAYYAVYDLIWHEQHGQEGRDAT